MKQRAAGLTDGKIHEEYEPERERNQPEAFGKSDARIVHYAGGCHRSNSSRASTPAPSVSVGIHQFSSGNLKVLVGLHGSDDPSSSIVRC